MAAAATAGRRPLVLVTGATSFVGTHCIKQLLEEGYPVRGTVRGLDSAKSQAVRECFEQYGGRLELVSCDLTRAEGWDAACKGCEFVLHVASPVEAHNFSSDGNRTLRPQAELQKAMDAAVNGTIFVVEAAKEAGVKRLVLTSSISAAIPAGWVEPLFPHPNVPGAYDPSIDISKPITEETWTTESFVGGYLLAKTQAEKAGWKAVKGSSLELVTILPPYVLGPQLHKKLWSDSVTPIDLVMQQSSHPLPALPEISGGFVDVRDVAKAHLKAMVISKAAGNRYLVSAGSSSLKDIAEILTSHFRPLGYPTFTKAMPKWVAWFLGLRDPLIFRMHRGWGRGVVFDGTKARKDLEMDFIEMRTSVIDTALASFTTGRYSPQPKSRSGSGGGAVACKVAIASGVLVLAYAAATKK